MAWFNTDWNIANMFNSPYGNVNTSDNPYGFTGGAGGNMITPWTNTQTGQTWDAPNTGYQPPNSNWQMTGGNKTNNLGEQNSVWGAPSYYQEPTSMFGNSYQAQDGGFYNPNIFGQMSYPSQYNTNQQPWWMNYNTNSSIVNPPNIPTTSVDPMDQGKYVGNPNHGGDEYETGPVYATADAAIEAGDYWSGYRKDHQQWRDSQGIYEGIGKQEGQSDLHYPGNPDLGIRSDKHQLNAMGMGGMLESALSLPSNMSAEQKKLLSTMISATPNAQGGNDYGVIGDGTVVLPNGTTLETQFTEKDELTPENIEEWAIKQVGPHFGARGPHYSPIGLEGDNIDGVTVIQAPPWSYNDKNIFTPKNSNVPFISDYSADSRFTPAGAVNADTVNENSLIMNGPFSAEEMQKKAEAEQRRYALTDGKINARWESEQISNNLRQQTLDSDPFIRKLVADGMLSMDQVPFSQISPYGQTVGNMTYPVQDKDINIFNGGDSNAYLNSQREALAAAAESKANAEAYEAEQKKIAEDKAAAAAKVAEKARQANAAQKRMNDRYETGPVTPNIFTSKKPTVTDYTKSYSRRYGL
jgi:hypothetical protein